MKKLAAADLLDIAAYERVREERLDAVIRLKKHRRVAVGPLVTLVFENSETIRSQIQEMMRAERLVRDEAIRAELDVYNELLPGESELAATLYIEVDDPDGASLLVLGWGSSYGAIQGAARRLRHEQGLRVATAHIKHLNPLPANTGEVLRAYKRVLVHEVPGITAPEE